ncbi:MAG: hypothetical protein WCA24_10740, partial [Thiomonas sp.]
MPDIPSGMLRHQARLSVLTGRMLRQIEPVHIMKNRWIVLGAVMTLTATIAWASLGQTNPLHIPASARSTIPTSTARV